MHSLDIKRILSALYTHIFPVSYEAVRSGESRDVVFAYDAELVAGCSHMRNISASLMVAGRTPNLTSFCKPRYRYPAALYKYVYSSIALHTLSLSDLTQEEKKNSYTVGTLHPKDNSPPVLVLCLYISSPSSLHPALLPSEPSCSSKRSPPKPALVRMTKHLSPRSFIFSQLTESHKSPATPQLARLRRPTPAEKPR